MLRALLAQFGVRTPFAIEREFLTHRALPKVVVRLEPSGERLFVGSLHHTWPPLGHLNATLPLLDTVRDSLAGADAGVAIGRYRRTAAGACALRYQGLHLFVRDYFDDARVDPTTPRTLHARALAVFHEHGREALPATGQPCVPSERQAAVYREWLLPQLAALRALEPDRPAAPLRLLFEGLARDAAAFAGALDRLPLYLVHGDYQPKNILAGPRDTAGGQRIVIIDLESAQRQSRLFDFYFLMTENDFGATLGDLDAFRTLLDAYFRVAPGLTDDEANLLGFALRTKAASVAVWAANDGAKAIPALQPLYRTWYAQAVRCLGFLVEHERAVRELAQAHRAGR